MEEYLDILPGSVSVMGLMNDKENAVTLLVDEDVLKGYIKQYKDKRIDTVNSIYC